MKKVLLYVDAENVSKADVTEQVNLTRKYLAEDEMLIGKFYGSQEQLGEMPSICYALGLEFVETSSIVASGKNVTDMKIVADCACDVYATYADVSRVVLLSSDSDFLPLCFKLISRGVNVHTPLYIKNHARKTLGDLENELINSGFSCIQLDGALFTLFPIFRSRLQAEYPDTLIKAFLDRKRRKFVRDAASVLRDEILEELSQIPIEEFGFDSVVRLAKVTAIDNHSVGLMDLFTKKFFGQSYSTNNICYRLQEVIHRVCEGGNEG